MVREKTMAFVLLAFFLFSISSAYPPAPPDEFRVPSPIPSGSPIPSPSVYASASITPPPASPSPQIGGGGVSCSVDNDCRFLSSSSYCDGGYCTSCSFACVSDSVCVPCCARSGRADPDCITSGGGYAGSPSPSPSPRPTPPPQLVEVKKKVNVAIQEAKDLGEDTSDIEDLVNEAEELELQGKHEEAQGLLDVALSRLTALLSRVRGSKTYFGWAFAGLLIFIIIAVSLYYTSALKRKKDEKAEEETGGYVSEVSEDFAESDPDRPIDLDIKRRKRDIE